MTDVLDQEVFRYTNDSTPQLMVEGVPLSKLANEFGTPLYVYSKRQIIENFQAFNATLKSSGKEHYVSYALKANSNIELLRILAAEGAGADVVSAGELLVAVAAGFSPDKITFDGTGKTDAEIELALKASIHAFNVESLEELTVINEIATRIGVRAKVSIRVNPNVDAKSHPYISTGLKENKFGIDMGEAREAFLYASSHAAIEVVGIHVHIGSQITSLDPFIKAARSTVKFVNSLRVKSGILLEHLNFGGGQGIHYRNVVRHPQLPPDEMGEEGEYVPSLSEFVGAVLPILDQTGLKIIFEPGRAIVANSCALLATVLYTKANSVKHFVITDTGMTELIRPCLYDAYHQVVPLALEAKAPSQRVDIVGPICETSDFLAQAREMPPMKRGDRIAVLCAGAYGYTLASNYNLRPRAAEILVDGDTYRVIRERESIETVAGVSESVVAAANGR
ncbi:MAG: diaminopimelate decarboxylase [Bacteroidota bacterium]|nr:diaminopimelate decarboxylase [Bacteroidota bacterium]MDP4232383.1 diaminopimelate decarboxylase [Bacteroidota bacterium]MDP4241520.1 diaminopimelate decarboxylase [Bacteroidota bacterium]MDP4288254.1 diaminopimelate decarboxylase [Bacteroidota bacterium]